MHRPLEATYVKMAILNYTISVLGYKYYAFYKYPHEQGAYTLSLAMICDKLEHFVSLGCDLIAFNGGFILEKLFGNMRIFEKFTVVSSFDFL